MTTTSDMAAALAKALPADGEGKILYLFASAIAKRQAANLAEQGWVLVRPDDEATVERVAADHHIKMTRYDEGLIKAERRRADQAEAERDKWTDHATENGRKANRYLARAERAEARAKAAEQALAALAARPGGADTEQAEVDRG